MRHRAAVAAFILSAATCAIGAEDGRPSKQACLIARQEAQLDRAISFLEPAGGPALQNATPSSEYCAETAGELGKRLYRAGRYEEARRWLSQAHCFYSDDARARYALDLGNVEMARNDPEGASVYYREAALLARHDPIIRISAELNLARQSRIHTRYEELVRIAGQVHSVPDAHARARLHLNIATQALNIATRTLTLSVLGQKAAQLAHFQLIKADELASITGKPRLRIEIQDSLAQLYENEGRVEDSLRLTRQALSDAKSMRSLDATEVLVHLEWRQGRLLRRLGRREQAIAAYLRAVAYMEAVRQDVPIVRSDVPIEPVATGVGEDRSSSYETLIKPLYLETVDLLLSDPPADMAGVQESRLSRVRDTLELLRQSEMQDYLGDRCTVEAVQGERPTRARLANTAVLYPILLDDRVELLLQTDNGIERGQTPKPVRGLDIQRQAESFAQALRSKDNDAYMSKAQDLYDNLIEPFASTLAKRHIDTLVLAVDGSLRLVPFGALHDGQQFLIKRFAISVVTGMSMTNTTAPSIHKHSALIAGLANPAPQGVVASSRANDPHEAPTQGMRPLLNVTQEVRDLKIRLGGTSLLDKAFTSARFLAEAESGEFPIVHIASHGEFSGEATTSYVMAYDTKLTMETLKKLLESEELRRSPLELLTLSACKTADGDAKSPLGIAGVAMRARARSVLGTLWSVQDDVALRVMNGFYTAWIVDRASKGKALQRAQIAVMQIPEFRHPYFWAPFVLIGNWQ